MSYHSGNELIDPYLLFEKVHLHPGMHVADFGCGRTGHIIFPAASVLGDNSIIYAVDILKDVLESVQKRAKMDGLLNIHTVWGDMERRGGVAIPPRSLDVIFLVNALGHVTNRQAVLEEAERLLKEKARCLIVDWMKTGLPFCPPEERLVDFGEIARWARSREYAVQEEFSAGKYHKGMVLFKQD